MTEMSHPRPVDLYAYFGYRDAAAAIAWLERAFKFEVIMSFPDERGGIAHAELLLGDAAIVVFSDREGYLRAPCKGETTGAGAYLVVSDRNQVNSMYARALDAGATVIWQPEANEWGNYRCRVLDPEGIEWTLGTYRPGVRPVAVS